jgi:hypothetical protein
MPGDRACCGRAFSSWGSALVRLGARLLRPPRSTSLGPGLWRPSYKDELSGTVAEVAYAPNFKDVVAWAVGVAEVSDVGTSVACFDRGFGGWVPDDHDVPDPVGSPVGVPEDQVAWLLLAGLDAGAVAGRQPVALRCGGAGYLDANLGVGGLGETEQSHVCGPAAPIR